MAINYIAANEPIVGEGSASYPDSKNRVGRQLASAILEEHTATGAHLAPYDVFPQLVYDTYTGTSATQTITLSISDDVTIKAVFIWSASYGSLYFRTDTMTKTKDVNGGIFYTGAITAFSDNTFTLGSDDSVNDSGVTYYYAALVTSGWTDTGSNSSPPTWIVHNTAMLGGISTTMANSVEKDLYEDKFETEHSEAGIHDSSAFSGISKLETGTFTVSGLASQVVDLVDTDMDIKIFFVWADDIRPAYLQTETMSKIKPLNNTVLTNTGFLSLGTGTITVNGTVLLDEETVLDIPDGTTGSEVFTDSSDYAIPLARSSWYTCEWSNTYAQGGTTSIKYDGGYVLSVDPLVETSLSLTEDFNIEFQFHSGSATLQDHTVFWIYSFTPINMGVKVEIVSNVIQVTFGLASDPITITTTTALNDVAWHQVNIKREAGLVFVEIDSAQEGSSVNNSTRILPDNLRIGLGSGAFTASAFNYVDEVIVKRTPALFQTDQEYHYLAIGI